MKTLKNLPIGSIVYVAGKMRGVHCFNYKNFFHAQVELERAGYNVVNPAELDCMRMIETQWRFTDDKYEEVMQIDLDIVKNKADAVYLLDGWWDSPGAQRELECAVDNDKLVFFEMADTLRDIIEE